MSAIAAASPTRHGPGREIIEADDSSYRHQQVQRARDSRIMFSRIHVRTPDVVLVSLSSPPPNDCLQLQRAITMQLKEPGYLRKMLSRRQLQGFVMQRLDFDGPLA